MAVEKHCCEKRCENFLQFVLSPASYGIICLTPENLASPWIHFEVGALFKGSGESHVCP